MATSRRLGLKLAGILGGLHLGIVLVLAGRILVLAMHPVAQWQLEWLTLERLDWPVSQFLWWHGWPRGPYEALPYPLQDPFWFLVPLFVFGVLGSAWYGLLAGAVGCVADRVGGRRRGRQSCTADHVGDLSGGAMGLPNKGMKLTRHGRQWK